MDKRYRKYDKNTRDGHAELKVQEFKGKTSQDECISYRSNQDTSQSPPPPPAAAVAPQKKYMKLTEFIEMGAPSDRHYVLTVEPHPSDTGEMFSKRNRIIREIVSTEITYQVNLCILVKYFMTPLMECGLISKPISVQLFGNIKQIIAVQKELIKRLETTEPGEAFTRLIPFLKLYGVYADRHEKGIQVLMSLKRANPQVDATLLELQARPEVKGQNFDSLLILPIQRIPRYVMLLEDLLKYTSTEHRDYNNIKESTLMMRQVAEHINEQIRSTEQRKRMLQLQNTLVISKRLLQRLVVPGRKFIREGFLKKVSRNGGNSLKRLFLLFSDVLIYCKPIHKFAVGNNTELKYSGCCVLPLIHCTVSSLVGSSVEMRDATLFTISCKDVSLLLYSDCDDVLEWTRAINSTIETLKEARQSIRKRRSLENYRQVETPVKKQRFLSWAKGSRQQKVKSTRAIPLSPLVECPDVGRAPSNTRINSTLGASPSLRPADTSPAPYDDSAPYDSGLFSNCVVIDSVDFATDDVYRDVGLRDTAIAYPLTDEQEDDERRRRREEAEQEEELDYYEQEEDGGGATLSPASFDGTMFSASVRAYRGVRTSFRLTGAVSLTTAADADDAIDYAPGEEVTQPIFASDSEYPDHLPGVEEEPGLSPWSTRGQRSSLYWLEHPADDFIESPRRHWTPEQLSDFMWDREDEESVSSGGGGGDRYSAAPLKPQQREQRQQIIPKPKVAKKTTGGLFTSVMQSLRFASVINPIQYNNAYVTKHDDDVTTKTKTPLPNNNCRLQ